jgi:hypothetical protein
MPLADYIGRYWTGAEVMYGVIIAMTFTSVLRGYPVMLEFVVQRVVFAALFCCIAWGIADGMFYLWERNYLIRQENRIIESSRSTGQRAATLSLIGEQLDDTVLRNIPGNDRVQLYERLSQFLAGVKTREKIAPREAATILFGTFLLSAGAGVIVVLPFFFIDDAGQALIVSNLAGILLLFGIGYTRTRDRSFPLKVLYGFGSSFIGVIIAVITIALGG